MTHFLILGNDQPFLKGQKETPGSNPTKKSTEQATEQAKQTKILATEEASKAKPSKQETRQVLEKDKKPKWHPQLSFRSVPGTSLELADSEPLCNRPLPRGWMLTNCHFNRRSLWRWPSFWGPLKNFLRQGVVCFYGAFQNPVVYLSVGFRLN